MTLRPINFIWSQRCDMCGKWCNAGTNGWYNPITRKAYHEGCHDDVEFGTVKLVGGQA